MLIEFEEGLAEGLSVQWYKNGQRKKVGTFSRGQLSGLETTTDSLR